MIKRYVKLSTLLTVKIPLLLKHGIFYGGINISPFPCPPLLFQASSAMAEDPYVFYSTGSFTGREEEGEERQKQRSTAHPMWAKAGSAVQTHSQPAACAHRCRHTAAHSSCLLPHCWWHSSSARDVVSVLPSCTGKCKEYAPVLKHTCPVRRARAEEAISLLYKQACSKAAAGSGWQMDIFFLSPLLPPKQRERCCQAASVSAYSPR